VKGRHGFTWPGLELAGDLVSDGPKWPYETTVHEAVDRRAEDAARKRPGVKTVCYFGSQIWGNWGVGSDVDLLVIVDRSELPFGRRPAEWDNTKLRVPRHMVIYTQKVWSALEGRLLATVASRFLSNGRERGL